MTEELQEKPIQYAFEGGAYSPCGGTKPVLPAGIYRCEDLGWGRWGFKPESPTSDDLIDIPGTIADDIFTDIDSFLSIRDRFAAFGLTHKRGYLFYGPPGSGKTSIAMMLARRFVRDSNGIVVYIDDSEALENAVNILKNVEPGRPSMYLIEEADNFVDDPTCLGILDGELSITGAVFVAMTNYHEKLPPRISNRPGRFDRVEYVACPPPGVQVEYLRRVMDRAPTVALGKPTPEAIVQALAGIPLSMAHLREAFIGAVLMDVSLREIRRRFVKMAGSDDEQDHPDVVAAKKIVAKLKRTARRGKRKK